MGAFSGHAFFELVLLETPHFVVGILILSLCDSSSDGPTSIFGSATVLLFLVIHQLKRLLDAFFARV